MQPIQNVNARVAPEQKNQDVRIGLNMGYWIRFKILLITFKVFIYDSTSR